MTQCRMASASIAEIEACVAGQTVPRRFVALVDEHPDLPLLHRMIDGSPAAWQTWTARDVADNLARTAAGLRACGVGRGERVLLMMRNRPEFHWLDLAIQCLRATPVSIYNSSSADEIAYIARHAGAAVAIVEDATFLDRILHARDKLPTLRRIFVLDPPTGPLPDGVLPADTLGAAEPLDLARLADDVIPSDVATVIYTSGTTGPPKAVPLTQHNVVYTVEQLRRCISFETYAGKRVISFLPMAHIAERMMSLYHGAMLGFSVYCCPDVNELSVYLRAVRPQLMFGVPRVWEKIHSGINAALATDPERKQRFDEGVALAAAIRAATVDVAPTDEQRSTLEFLDAVAFAQAREAVGLDALELAVSGAAPLPRQVLEWFDAIGVPLTEIYGTSESSGPITWSPRRPRIGTVGRAIPGCEVRLADDGEIMCRGGNVFDGYVGDPATTERTLDDGWLRTGDIGELDDDGYLRIVDRKKELIITSGGKNVSPANLEAELRTIPLVGHAAAIGDGRRFMSALLVLDPDAAAQWAQAHGRHGAALADLARDPDVIAQVQRGVDAVNERLSHAEAIKRFTVVGDVWLPDSDVLTPTSKLKRRGVHARYAAEIEAMYA